MKLQIDTDNKIIRIENQIKFDDLIKTLEALLPNDQWREYMLDTTVINNFSYPITLPTIPSPSPYPYYGGDMIYYTSDDGNHVYNFELNY